MNSVALVVLFLLTAFVYAMIGFGGGSTYTALLALADTDYRLIPLIALACNIVVVTGGVVHFQRAGHLRSHELLPFAVASVPAAALGGALFVPEQTFFLLLGLALLASGLSMLLRSPAATARTLPAARRWSFGLTSGAALGLLAGIVGIGGGIFLAPLLHLVNWTTPKRVAAIASGFILINSLAGIAGQLSKWARADELASLSAQTLLPYAMLPLAVLVGGQAGSFIGANRASQRWIARLTAILILYVGARLLIRAVIY